MANTLRPLTWAITHKPVEATERKPFQAGQRGFHGFLEFMKTFSLN